MNLEQFRQWALNAGSVGNPTADSNNAFVGECASLVQQYLNKVYNITWTPRGDAKDWPSNGNVLSYFNKVSSPQAGDIGVSGAVAGNKYGHIWIYLSPTTILEQNGRVGRRVSMGQAYANPIAILRRKGGEMPLTPEQQDKAIKMGLRREPTATELNDPNWRNNPGLMIDTLWENGGKQAYADNSKGEYEKLPFDVYKKKG